MKHTIALEADDFSPLNHRFDILEKLRDRYPNFKITMFTIPWDIRYERDKGGLAINQERFVPWVNAVKHAVEDGWLEVAIHGLTHIDNEFGDMDYSHAKNRIEFAKAFFDDVGIKIAPLFKAPFWLINEDGKKAVKDCGLTLVEDHYYNWNIKDQFPVEEDVVIGHGHVQNTCGNGLDESLLNLMTVPKDYEWKFVSEVLNES